MLKQIIEKLFCKHKWITRAKINTFNEGESEQLGYLPYQTKVTFICDICGKIKQIIL